MFHSDYLSLKTAPVTQSPLPLSLWLCVLRCLLTAPSCHSASISFCPPAWIHQFKSYLATSPCSLSLNAYIPQASALSPPKLFPLPCTQISFSPFIFYSHFLLCLRMAFQGHRKGTLSSAGLSRDFLALFAFFSQPPSPAWSPRCPAVSL